ncbi:MAG: alpha/beta fold hydrolase [Candidatus Saganbacteria bacterium]|nr:alpha/beta fold hydrolase [Candidatus Saganbacteria bacterium]
MDLFLHGFGATPELWPEGGPQLHFDDLEREAEKIGRGIRRGRRMRVVGWSMGGMVAQLIAAKYPEKVSELVLISTAPKFIASDDFPYGLPMVLLKRLEQRIKREGIKAFHSLVFPGGHEAGLADLTVAEAEKELKALEKVDLRQNLSKIKAPTLIIHGERDEICLPGAAAYMNQAIAGSELVMLPGVGHAPMVEAPERFKEALCSTKI